MFKHSDKKLLLVKNDNCATIIQKYMKGYFVRMKVENEKRIEILKNN